MKSTLESLGLPPKLLSLTTGKETEEVELQLESTELQGRINRVIARVGKAKFTDQDDAQRVPGLYKDFVEKITSKLQDTLALDGGAETQNDSVARSGSAGAVELQPPSGRVGAAPRGVFTAFSSFSRCDICAASSLLAGTARSGGVRQGR